jgi:hypothetical protein
MIASSEQEPIKVKEFLAYVRAESFWKCRMCIPHVLNDIIVNLTYQYFG